MAWIGVERAAVSAPKPSPMSPIEYSKASAAPAPSRSTQPSMIRSAQSPYCQSATPGIGGASRPGDQPPQSRPHELSTRKPFDV